MDYEARCHLSIFSTNGSGSPSCCVTLDFVEERAPVRIGITDTIVAIEVQRAGIVTIVSIAKQFSATETANEGSTCNSRIAVAKVIQLFQLHKVKERFFLKFARPSFEEREAPGRLVCLVLFENLTCSGCLDKEWFRRELLCPFAEERAPVRSGITDTRVAIEVQRAGIVTIVSTAKQ